MGEVREVAEGGADMVEGTQGSKNIFVKSAVVHGCLSIATSRKFFQISSPSIARPCVRGGDGRGPE